MKKQLAILSVALVSIFPCSGQDLMQFDPVTDQQPLFDEVKLSEPAGGAARNLYVEILGNSLLWSITYDQRFGTSRDGIGGRAGIGFLSFGTDAYYMTVPLMVNYLLGKDSKFFELGLGGIIYVSDQPWFYAQSTTLIGTMTLGFRRQPEDGGMLWKIALTPIFGSNGGDGFYFWPFYGGISFGYAFP